jgi:hypothetical protein
MTTHYPIDRPRLSGPIACVIMSALAVASALCGSEPKAPTPVTIARMASAKCGSRIPTRVTLTGFVADVTKEADGDYHLKVCSTPTGRICTIVEIIPPLGADRIVAPLKRVARSMRSCGRATWSRWPGSRAGIPGTDGWRFIRRRRSLFYRSSNPAALSRDLEG